MTNNAICIAQRANSTVKKKNRDDEMGDLMGDGWWANKWLCNGSTQMTPGFHMALLIVCAVMQPAQPFQFIPRINAAVRTRAAVSILDAKRPALKSTSNPVKVARNSMGNYIQEKANRRIIVFGNEALCLAQAQKLRLAFGLDIFSVEAKDRWVFSAGPFNADTFDFSLNLKAELCVLLLSNAEMLAGDDLEDTLDLISDSFGSEVLTVDASGSEEETFKVVEEAIDIFFDEEEAESENENVKTGGEEMIRAELGSASELQRAEDATTTLLASLKVITLSNLSCVPISACFVLPLNFIR
jgi:hypothetical protein